MITKRDYFIAALNGVVTAVFAIAIFFFLDLDFPVQIPAIPTLWILGVWLGGFLGKRLAPFFTQFGKFAAVGFSSAAIDFAILNFMSYATGATAGVTVGWINIPGFLVAVVNGYLWNKLWVFGMPSSLKSDFETPKKSDFFPDGISPRGGLFSDFPKFFGVTLVGLLINSIIIVLLTTYFPAPAFSEKIWMNIAKVIANSLAMMWNFIGYKFFAFK